jgi:hypothetical protein
MKLYIGNAADRDSVIVILARNGYTVRQGKEKPPGAKTAVSFVEYGGNGAFQKKEEEDGAV